MGFINGLKRLQREVKGLPGERQKRGDANGGADRRQRLQHRDPSSGLFEGVDDVTQLKHKNRFNNGGLRTQDLWMRSPIVYPLNLLGIF